MLKDCWHLICWLQPLSCQSLPLPSPGERLSLMFGFGYSSHWQDLWYRHNVGIFWLLSVMGWPLRLHTVIEVDLSWRQMTNRACQVWNGSEVTILSLRLMVGCYAVCYQSEITRPVASAVACRSSQVEFQHQLLEEGGHQLSWSSHSLS